MLAILYLIVCIASIYAKDCDELGILLYEDLGCTPELGDDQTCPKKYSCKGLEPGGDKCYFRGRAYENREQVDSSLVSLSCDAGCYCMGGPAPTDKIKSFVSSFRCAILDCPEWLGVPIAPNCYRKYSLDRCCSTGQVCPPFDNLEKCVVEGKEYREGEKFYPSDTCLKCVCQKGFKGKLEEPFCRRMLCGQQLKRSGASIQSSCAPFYSKELNKKVLCCPDDWICPDGSETIKGDAKSDEICNIGEKTVKVGQYFEKADVKDGYGRSFKKVRCECVVPPFMKCVDV